MAKPALFGSYNARFVDPQTVADSFVLRAKEFGILCQQDNSLVVGPRGSGKTTLLKMLKISAQQRWSKTKKPLKRIPFTAIYVGAERQFDLLTADLDRTDGASELLDLLAKSLFATRVKFACLETLREISDPLIADTPYHVAMSKGDEFALCSAISNIWGAEKCYSINELRSALYQHIAAVNMMIDRLRYGVKTDIGAVIEESRFITHDPMYACTSFVDIFDSVFPGAISAWALCIDELEIMSTSLQQRLFSGLRSIDQRVLLKLATSPFTHIGWDGELNDGPMAGHDFTAINLAFANKKDAKRFTEKLFDALLNAEGIKRGSSRPAERAERVLGASPIQEANTSHIQRRAYASPDGEHYKRFASLRDKDPSFREFLRDRHITLERLYDEPEHRRAAVARKYLWQVAIRNEFGPTNVFSRGESIQSRARSRKRIPDIYVGYDSLVTVCEGNPRTTIGLLRPLARHFTGTSEIVPLELQAANLQTAVAKYVSLLSTIPVEDGTGRSVIDVLDQIGEYLSLEVNGPSFKAEPAIAVRIDRKVPAPVQEAIGNAMNQGAFVMLEDQAGLFDFGSLPGSRLRLSYLLCPRYHLPLTFGKTVNLSTILESAKRGSFHQTLRMRDLFAGGDDSEDYL